MKKGLHPTHAEHFEGYKEKGMSQGWQYSIPNPMHQTEFEKSLCRKEVKDRDAATEKYVKGIQGKDGGCFPSEEYGSQLPLDPLGYK